MTDISSLTNMLSPKPARRLDTTSPAAIGRIKSRYRAESRYRSYGVAALAVTTVFLVSLISSIIIESIPAFSQNSVVLDVPMTAEKIDPKGTRDVKEMMSSDYAAVARDALIAAVPGVEGRAARKQLFDVLSTGAGDNVREAVSADPSVIGKTIPLQLLVSDDVDLYLKGIGTAVRDGGATRGIATPSGTTGEVSVLVAANDFADDILIVKNAAKARAERLRSEAGRLEIAAPVEQKDRIEQLRSEATELLAGFEKSNAEETLDSRMPSMMIAINGGLIKIAKLTNSSAKGEVILPLKSAADAAPGTWKVVTYETPEADRRLPDRTVAFIEKLRSEGKVVSNFNWMFFTSGDSREPELAGIRVALVGSAMLLAVTLALCLPIGVLSAIYLEEFAPKNRLTDLIEININNLAAVPSIVFGLLGLAVFLNFFGLPRSAPLVGGLVMALLVLPTIIIAARAALKAVPPSIKEAALGVGASKQQAIFHHVLPLAMPGIMTGTIIGMAHALGETAPLLMIGMIAFIVDVPGSITEAATALPVQIFLWSDLPEAAFQAKTAAAIVVLLGFLVLMNGMAIWLRRRFERRW